MAEHGVPVRRHQLLESAGPLRPAPDSVEGHPERLGADERQGHPRPGLTLPPLRGER